MPPAEQRPTAVQDGASIAKPQQPEPPKSAADDFVLDHYPSAVKTSLLDTARGVVSFKSARSDSAPSNQAQGDKSGNLFSLLESASSKSPGAPAPSEYTEPESSYSEAEEPGDVSSAPVSASEEEARREEIRNRFLEAIRAAAERRQAEAEIE